MRAGPGFFARADFRVGTRQNREGRGRGGRGGGVEACGFEDGFELSGSHDGVDFRDVFLDLVAIALDKAASDDEFFCAAAGFVTRHLKDGRNGFLLSGVNEGTGVDDEDFGVFGAGGEACTCAVEEAHHDLGVNEVFGAAERDEADSGSPGSGLCFLGWDGGERFGHSSILRGA